jgi:hypothetical protein
MFEENRSQSALQGPTLHVCRPERGCLGELREAFRALVRPKPMAFSVARGEVSVDHFTVGAGDSFGPLAYVADARRFFCYSAHYRDGVRSIVIVVGDSLSRACGGSDLNGVLGTIRLLSERHDGIRSHVLTSINTPLALSSFHERTGLIKSCNFFEKLLTQSVRGTLHSLPAAQLINVNLNGWSLDSSKLPRCVFHLGKESEAMMLQVFPGCSEDEHTDVILSLSQPSPQ